MPIHFGEEALARLDAEHDALCHDVGVPVTGRATWMRAVLELDRAAAVYVEVRGGGQRVAGVPLVLRRRRLQNQVEAPGPGVTDSHWFPARDEGSAQQLAHEIAALLHSLGRWRLQVDSAPQADACVDELTRLLHHHRVSPGDGMPRLVIGEERALASYLSKNSRYQSRRGVRTAQERGLAVDVAVTRDPSVIAADLPEVMAVHRARDLELGRFSDIDEPAFAALYAKLVTNHARQGEVQLLTVRLDGALAAYSLMFVDGAALRMWDGRVNPAHGELSMGRFCNLRMVEEALADVSVSEVDYMRGEEPYKASYTNDVVPTVDLWAWSGVGPRSARRAYELARDVKRRSPALSQAWTRLRSRLR